MSLSSLLDVEKYSIRVKQADITRIPEILKAVSKEEIARMQALIAKVAKRSAGVPWHRMHLHCFEQMGELTAVNRALRMLMLMLMLGGAGMCGLAYRSTRKLLYKRSRRGSRAPSLSCSRRPFSQRSWRMMRSQR